jgi:hypothetical protein
MLSQSTTPEVEKLVPVAMADTAGTGFMAADTANTAVTANLEHIIPAIRTIIAAPSRIGTGDLP